jgi:ribosomal protein S18 acetylase RimI-like enzyme
VLNDSIAIRPTTATDEPILREMLYHAIYVPSGGAPPLRAILDRPELNRYVDRWGKSDDLGFIAEVGGQPIGAAWLRLMAGEGRGYGYVNDETPVLSMAVLPDRRGRGIGTRLLTHLLGEAARRYRAVSLSVAADNPARRLYERHDFAIIDENGNTLTMIRHFSDPAEWAAATSA